MCKAWFCMILAFPTANRLQKPGKFISKFSKAKPFLSFIKQIAYSKMAYVYMKPHFV
jgi:hypothetical protein